MRGVARHLGEYQACKTGLVPSFDVDYHLEGDLRASLDDDHGLFTGLGLHALAKDITQATRVRERFAPAPKDQPLLLDRDRPWSPAEYTIPGGRIVTDVLDIPIDAVLTAVWDNASSEHVIDGSEGRGVSPLIRLLHTAHAEAGGDISTAAPDTDRHLAPVGAHLGGGARAVRRAICHPHRRGAYPARARWKPKPAGRYQRQQDGRWALPQ